MSCTVHEAGPDDWRRTRALRLRALAAAPDAYGSSLAREVHQPDSFWQHRLERALATFIAVLDGEDVGIAVVAGGLGEPQDAALYGMWVEPAALRAGVGSALATDPDPA